MNKSSAIISERRIDAALEDNDTKTGRHTLLEILIEQKLRIYIIRIGLGYNTLLKIPTKKMGHKISHNQSIILNPAITFSVFNHQHASSKYGSSGGRLTRAGDQSNCVQHEVSAHFT